MKLCQSLCALKSSKLHGSLLQFKLKLKQNHALWEFFCWWLGGMVSCWMTCQGTGWSAEGRGCQVPQEPWRPWSVPSIVLCTKLLIRSSLPHSWRVFPFQLRTWIPSWTWRWSNRVTTTLQNVLVCMFCSFVNTWINLMAVQHEFFVNVFLLSLHIWILRKKLRFRSSCWPWRLLLCALFQQFCSCCGSSLQFRLPSPAAPFFKRSME